MTLYRPQLDPRHINRHAFLFTIFSVVLISFPPAGCSHKSGSNASNPNGAAHENAFDTAQAPIRSLWERATAAVSTNDYATAITTFRMLEKKKDLTAEQRKVVNEQLAMVSDELRVAVSKGYPGAKHALEQVRENSEQAHRSGVGEVAVQGSSHAEELDPLLCADVLGVSII